MVQYWQFIHSIHLRYILYCIKYNSYTYIPFIMAFNLYAMIMLILYTVIMCIAYLKYDGCIKYIQILCKHYAHLYNLSIM